MASFSYTQSLPVWHRLASGSDAHQSSQKLLLENIVPSTDERIHNFLGAVRASLRWFGGNHFSKNLSRL
jgi:hypothetical protein